MPTTLPNLLRYPASTDTPNVPRDTQRIVEDVELALVGAKLPWFGKPYIESGAALTAPGGLFLAVAAGVACINGWRFAFTATTTVPLVASTTNHVWLTQTLDGNGRHSGFLWTVLQTTAVPANSVYVGQVVTGAAGITTNTASFRGVIAPGIQIARPTPVVANVTHVSPAGASTVITMDLVGDGVSKVDVEAMASAITANVAATYMQLFFYDATLLAQLAESSGHAPGANYYLPIGRMGIQLPAWVGLKTVALKIFGTANTSSVIASAQAPATLEANWAI